MRDEFKVIVQCMGEVGKVKKVKISVEYFVFSVSIEVKIQIYLGG